MAKLAPGVRLLRSLVRSAKSQKKLLNALTPKPVKARRKPAPRVRPPLAGAPAAGSWTNATYLPPPLAGLAVQGMRYWLYVPAREPDGAAQRGRPLVVMLHGCQQSAPDFAQGTRMNRLAEQKGYAVLYPQQPIAAHAQRCWRWHDRTVQQGGAETAVLAALIDDVCGRHAIDRGRVYACGLSAGAGMAAVLALNHPELIAAVGLHSGPVFGAGHSTVGALQVMRYGAEPHVDAAIANVLARRPMPAMPAILIQGEDDQVVRRINQQQLTRQWLRLNGLPVAPPARVALRPAGQGGRSHAHAIEDYLAGRKIVLRVVRIAGLGHAWSGGDPALTFNAKPGPNASRLVLDFFARHRR